MGQDKSPSRRWPRCGAVLPYSHRHLQWLDERLSALERLEQHSSATQDGADVLELFPRDTRDYREAA
jgi:hypothetical protein